MGEGATIQIRIDYLQHGLGFLFRRFGGLSSFSMFLPFISIYIDFKKRQQKNTKFIEIIID